MNSLRARVSHTTALASLNLALLGFLGVLAVTLPLAGSHEGMSADVIGSFAAAFWSAL